MVRRSSPTSRGTTYWFQFLYFTVSQVFRLRMRMFHRNAYYHQENNVIKKIRKTKSSIPVSTAAFPLSEIKALCHGAVNLRHCNCHVVSKQLKTDFDASQPIETKEDLLLGFLVVSNHFCLVYINGATIKLYHLCFCFVNGSILVTRQLRFCFLR